MLVYPPPTYLSMLVRRPMVMNERGCASYAMLCYIGILHDTHWHSMLLDHLRSFPTHTDLLMCLLHAKLALAKAGKLSEDYRILTSSDSAAAGNGSLTLTFNPRAPSCSVVISSELKQPLMEGYSWESAKSLRRLGKTEQSTSQIIQGVDNHWDWEGPGVGLPSSYMENSSDAVAHVTYVLFTAPDKLIGSPSWN